MKYTPEMLADAATAVYDNGRCPTTSGNSTRAVEPTPTSGGDCDDLGIDTTHFTGRGHYSRPDQSSNRLTPDQILVDAAGRPTPSARIASSTRALRGRRCATSVAPAAASVQHGTNGRLVLHVDHINGDYADCRAE